MYPFCISQNVGGESVRADRTLFDQTIDSERVRVLCARIAEQYPFIKDCPNEQIKSDLQRKVSEWKRALPGICWHAAGFKGNKRNAFCAIASLLVMIDVDHVDDPRALYEQIKEMALELGLVAAHITPSTFGLRLVFVRPEGMSIEGMQQWITEKLQLKGVDGCCKDLARLSFVVPRDYWLYIDYEALFEGEVVERGDQDDHGVRSRGPQDDHGRETPGPVPMVSNTTYDTTYKDIPYDKIVESLETLFGGVPAHGYRNQQIFGMACQIRHICNNDCDWVAQVLPDYGEERSRWYSTIKSACKRNLSQNIPAVLAKAIEMASVSMETGTSDASVETHGRASQDQGTSNPPAMPTKLPKLISHLIKNVPEVCKPSVSNGIFPPLATHMFDVKFPLIDGTKKEATFMCVNMARQSSGKASLNKPIEYIMADIKERDDISRRREQEWKDAVGSKGSNKEKPKRPDDLCVQMLVTDMTNAAFVQRLKDAGNKYIYTNLEELDLLKQLQTNGTKDVGKIICLCFDNGTYGQERVGLQSVTALLPLRWNWNASSTIEKGRDFFKNRLIDGTLSRVNFCTIITDESKEFKYGEYDEQYAAELKPYITNLNLCKGEIVCPQALAMAKRLQQKCTEMALQTEDVIYQEFSYRAVTIAYMKAMVLYIAQDMTWDKSIEEFCEWSLEYDLWCKNHFFGDLITEARTLSTAKKTSGRANMLNRLADTFAVADAQEVRRKQGKDIEGTGHMLSVWLHRGYITYDEETQKYAKTAKYKLKN